MERNVKFPFLSANVIKIIAVIFMTLDHIGWVLLPEVRILHILGRISMPLFAFMIAEGAYHTRNKVKYFSLIFLLGVAFQIVYYVALRSTYMGIFITFSTSILMIYALQFFKTQLFYGTYFQKAYSFLLFGASVVGTYFLNEYCDVDYGFWGCMLPVFASLFCVNATDKKGERTVKFNCVPVNVLAFAVGLLILAVYHAGRLGGIQYYALLALPILFLYSGKRGKWKMKYFFYVFYPAHLVVIYGISLLL